MNIVVFNGTEVKHGNLYNISKILYPKLSEIGNVTAIDEVFAPCKDCGYCHIHNRCIYPFPNDLLQKSDVIIILSPIYFFGLSGKAKLFLDRLYSVSLENKILTSVIISGTPPESYYSGLDLINSMFSRLSGYCGSIYLDPLYFVTYDSIISTEGIEPMINAFVQNIEATYNEIKN